MSAASLIELLQVATKFLTQMAPYLAVAACIFSLLALIAFTLLDRRLSRLIIGKNGSIEETLATLLKENTELREFKSEVETYLKHAEMRLRHSVQGVGIVRFNPFHSDGQGGNQSFAVSFLDESLSGVVFSTLYARDRVGVYAKPIESGISTYELSDEEKEAVEKASTQIAKHKKK